MNQQVRYFVCITERGPTGGRFGWAICRQDNSLEVKRSTESFETRIEALLASVHAAQSLAFPLDIDIRDPNCQATRRSSEAGGQPVKPQTQFDVDKAIALGFSAEAIDQLTGLAKRSTKSRAEVAAIAQHHLEDVKRRIKDLQEIANSLTVLIAGCSSALTIAECPIVQPPLSEG